MRRHARTLRRAIPGSALAHPLDSYGRDEAPSVPELLRTMRRRLHDLADWSNEHARVTGAHHLLDHAAMYRRDAERPGLPHG